MIYIINGQRIQESPTVGDAEVILVALPPYRQYPRSVYILKAVF